MWPISKSKTKNENQNFLISFLIWNDKTNFKKYISFFTFYYSIGKRKTKKDCFWIYFDLKSISKNKNQNFRIHFLISNQKMNFREFFHFSILVMKLKNEKRKIFKIRFVFKSKNELYFRHTDLATIFIFNRFFLWIFNPFIPFSFS